MNQAKSLILITFILFIGAELLAQFPAGINYQAVLRDNAGSPVSAESVVIQVDITKNSTDGPDVYSENHTTTTSALGLVNLVIGKGTNTSGSFEDIEWSSSSHFINISVSINGGDRIEFGSSELLAVPYAFHAQSVENSDDADPDPENETISSFELNGSSLDITEAGKTISVDLSGLGGGTVDLDADPSNELQVLSIDGYSLSISSGNSVTIPQGSTSPFNADTYGHTYSGGGLGIGQASDSDHSVIVTTTTNGLLAQTTGPGKFGLKGRATDGNSESYGVFGWADNGGIGVSGQTANNIGVEGIVWGDTEKTYGGHFTARGPEGVGVYGENTYTGTMDSYGGYFSANSNAGVGAMGIANGNDAVGVLGSSTNGVGVLGMADSVGVRGTGYTGVVGISDDFEFSQSGGYFFSYNRAVVGEAVGSEGHTPGGGYQPAPYGSYIGGEFTGKKTYDDQTATGIGVRAEGGRSGVEGEGAVYGIKGISNNGFLYYPGGTEPVDDAAGVSGQGFLEAYGVYGEAESMAGVKGVGVYGVQGEGSSYDFYASGAGADYGPFTGAHDALLAEGTPADLKAGMIVSNTGVVEKRINEDGSAAVSSTLPTVRLADRANDKAVFGVIVKEVKLNPDHWYEDKSNRAAVVNALGEGLVWVCNMNGDIEAGDYITTSDIAGYGQKQDDDVLHNFTLAKATETIDWNKVSETIRVNGKSYKVYLLGVVYVSG